MMLSVLFPLAVVAGAVLVSAIPAAAKSQTFDGVVNNLPANDDKYVLPMFDRSPSERAEEFRLHREGYLYGPSLIANCSYFPIGTLGKALVDREIDLWWEEGGPNTDTIEAESEPAEQAILQSAGLRDLSNFELLYKDQWKNSNPTGVSPGAFTNYTQDLFFSMERLSNNPYTVARLHPKANLPFEVDDAIVVPLTGMSLTELHASGRLFIVDHSYQSRYPTIKGRFTAACSALFYISPMTKYFLPLAIKTNVGSDLTYTPLDSQNDWLLAKIMFNMNDFFHGDIYHLGATHAVAEIVHQAALRTMADQHPVRGFLDQVMYRAYAVRPIGAEYLFNPGGAFEQVFAVHTAGVKEFTEEFYPTGAGFFQANYLDRTLTNRGLLNCSYGPTLEHFPFAEDAGVILKSLRAFATSFVESYYTSDHLLAQDQELQAWLIEASGPANVLDFPKSPLVQRDTLVDILAHMAYLPGIMHQALNGGSISASSGILPFHPAALYRPAPSEKNVASIMPFLPDVNASLTHIKLLLGFNRPNLINSSGDLGGMFVSPKFLRAANAAVSQASKIFAEEMAAISEDIQARAFDANGLAQGMPFIWRSLDPRRIPFFLSV